MTNSKCKLKKIALGITSQCSHNCAFCYETAGLERSERHDGDIKVLFQIADKLQEAGVEIVQLTGGDPAEHLKIGVLAHYLCDLGLKVIVASNTHYTWKDVAPYVSALEWTVHGPQSYHDAYTRPGYYREVLRRLKSFAQQKREDQQIGITLNLTPLMETKLFSTVNRLAMELPIDYIQVRRILCLNNPSDQQYKLDQGEIIEMFRQIKRIDEQLGIAIEMVDAFPHCLLPADLQEYNRRCEWGYSMGYVDMKGNFSRCPIKQNPIGNILNQPLSELYNHRELVWFRKKEYLPGKCQVCEHFKVCGGGCPISQGRDTHNLLSFDPELDVDELVRRYFLAL